MPIPEKLKSLKVKLPKSKGKKTGASWKFLLRILFSHIGLLILVSLYAVAGAYILMSLEQDGELNRIQKRDFAIRDLNDTRRYIINYAWYHSEQNHSAFVFKEMVRRKMLMYRDFIVESVHEKHYGGPDEEWDWDWTFPKALLFTVTTISTIGYGHIVPKSEYGQIFTIYYGMIGIPLLLLFLTNIGNTMATSLRFVYSRLCCRMCRIKRVLSEGKKPKSLKQRILWKEKAGKEKYMPTHDVQVPIVLNLFVIAVYLIIGGAIFSFWENWDLSQAVYFTFVTLTTIGFGDYVPGNSFSENNAEDVLVTAMKILVTIVFLVFGMALVSMSISLMQSQIVKKMKWAAIELGISEDPELANKEVHIKRHDYGSVMETPYGRDGNQTKLSSVNE